MSFGPYCKALGIDEDVLNGQKRLTCEVEKFTNGVAWELRKHKISKKLSMKDVVDWFINILNLKCENDSTVENDLNDKFEKLASLRGTFLKAPKNYPGELERLMKWQFDLPQSMGVESAPSFEPIQRANLGPKLLKVLKEKGADVDDSLDLSGPSDDDDEQAKRRKAREEIVQLKRDLGSARKAIMGLNDRLTNLSKRCALLTDISKISVSERRRIETDITKLKAEWDEEITTWHDCIERLNHVNVNKANYLDVGYMVRRNKTKQGIFDELNFEFERTVEEFKHKVNSLLSKERQKKKPASREYKQKSKSDRKRVRQEGDDEKSEESKKMCLSEEVKKQEQQSISVEEFMKSESVEEFKNGKFASSLKAIYVDMISMPVSCKNVHEVFFSVLNSLESLNIDKIPSLSFAGNIYMEVRMLVMLQAYSDLINMSKISIANDAETKFKLVDTSYEVTLPNGTNLVLGVRDLSNGNPDTSLNFLKDVFGQLMSMKSEGNISLDELIQKVKYEVITNYLLDKKYMEVVFLYKQQILPKLKACLDGAATDYTPKIMALNSFCTGLYFLVGLAELVDVTVLAWELMSQNVGVSDSGDSSENNSILSKTLQNLNVFCTTVDSFQEQGDLGKEFCTFLVKEKKLDSTPLVPSRGNLFNTVFHNSAGVWFFHEIGIFAEFFEKIKEKDMSLNVGFSALSDKQYIAVVRSLGLIGKLVAIPLWTVLEDYDVEVGTRYATLLKKVESWAKDASKFMKGQEPVFDDIPISHDAVYISLIRENEASDAMTKEILELLFTAFIQYIQSFLYGSTKTESTDLNGDMDMDVKSTIQQDFSSFDRITKNIHSSSTFALDSLMLYSKTRNGEWQDKLCSRSNLKIFELIQRNANKQLKSLYKRKIKLNEIKEQMHDKKEEFSKCQLIEKRYKLIDDLIKWGGLWKSEKEVDERLKDMKESDRMNALKAQMRFRRHVLGEVHENNLLDLAYDGEFFNSAKLYENLKTVLRNECLLTETDIFELASATDDEKLKAQIYNSCKNAQSVEDGSEQRQNYSIKENFYWLLGKMVLHTFINSGNKETLSGICIARKKINGVYSYFMRYKERGVYKFSEGKIADDYKNKNLQVIEPSLKDLVGSRLSRAFFKNDGDLEWHDCQVIAITSGSEYVVEFDYYGSDLLQDPNDESPIPEIETLTFTSHLIEDYRTGRLRFL